MEKRYQLFVKLKSDDENRLFWATKVGADYPTLEKALDKVVWDKKAIKSYHYRIIYVGKYKEMKI